MLGGLLSNLKWPSTEPHINRAYVFYVALIDSTTGAFIIDPTIAAGDFKVSKDGGPYVPLTNLPVAMPTGSISTRIVLSADEMSSPKINVLGIDAAGNEWDDVFIPIDVPLADLTDEDVWDNQRALTVDNFIGLS